MMKLPPIAMTPRLGHSFVMAFGFIVQAPAACIRVARTATMKLRRQSDYKRWANLDNHLPWWSSRTEKVAELISDGTRVIEFGAGNRQLESLLGPNCSYVPSDLVDRGPGTVICDLNKRPLPDLGYLTMHIAVFVGVLEYVNDLPTLIEWLASQVTVCIVSYECVRSKPFSLSRIAETFHRAYYGYVSYYAEDQLLALFARNGFTCEKVETWRDQRLFVFAKSHPALERTGTEGSLRQMSPLDR
jgi:hypothetical protein